MYKLALKKYFIFLFILCTIVPTGIYIHDPYMLFHNKWFNKKEIYSNFRIQNYGLIKYGDFDSIIIGTSMLQNTSANEASQKLGSKFVNLSISRASFYERFKILKIAYKYKQIKHIIFSLDFYFSSPKEINKTFYPELYDDEITGKFNVYMTTKALTCVFFNLNCDYITYNLDRPNAWYKNIAQERRFGGFNNWLKYYEEDNQIKDAFAELLTNQKDADKATQQYKQIIDNEILPILSHKKTKYSIIIPPYSILWWANRKDYIDKYFEAYEYLIIKTANMSNVKIYWFYDTDIVNDIKRYKDLTHYHYTHNSEQIDAIKNGTNTITIKNYKNKFKNFKNIINKFNLEQYKNLILSKLETTT